MELCIGIDVSKNYLDVYINNIEDKEHKVENSEFGIEKLIKIFQNLQKNHDIQLIIFEATGGYERLLSIMLRNLNFPVHVAHPNKIRNFAKATGNFAKTDKIDARILSEFARVFRPSSKAISLKPEIESLRALFIRRQQLLEDKIRESNRLDKHILDILRHSIETHVKWLSSQIKEVEKLIDQQIESHEAIKNPILLLSSVPGIGTLTSVALLVGLPELGCIEGKQLAALVGVAPLNQDSGNKKGKRYIKGGRGSIRKSLYMSAIVSIRLNSDMKKFYQRLRAKGKAAKVALTAVIRKLLILLNSVVRRQTPWVDREQIA
ncbi:MAG TPA: IS110 family transposase [Chitinophagaceae bacterium]|mgnify:CR=1 FL=1|nr:IS110 family transposase [Chitinophagaceae bacterium]